MKLFKYDIIQIWFYSNMIIFQIWLLYKYDIVKEYTLLLYSSIILIYNYFIYIFLNSLNFVTCKIYEFWNEILNE